MSSTKNNDFWRRSRKYFREYLEVAGIHGLRYVSEKRSRVEKIVWVLILLISLAGFVYMVNAVLHRYNNSPVVVSFATENTPLYKIPFPAITICPEAGYSRDKFNFSGVYLRISNKEDVDNETLKTFDYLSVLCDEETIRDTKTVDEGVYAAFDELKLDPEEMFPWCEMASVSPSCKSVFSPVIIDQGVCYSYNILGKHEIFRNHVYQYADYYNVPRNTVDIFNIETGYSDSAGLDTYPRRATLSGADNSITIFLRDNPNNTDVFCTNFWRGFRVLIHNPWEVPRLGKHYFRIPLGKVVVATIEPEMTETSKEVRKFHPDKRKCYMNNERQLLHFQSYSQSNCMLECQTNYTLSQCGCVDYYMPRNNSTPICGAANWKCIDAADNRLKMKELEYKLDDLRFCDCRPSCSQLKFHVGTSQSDFYYDEFLQARYKEYYKADDSRWSVLQVYFKEDQFVTIQRNELYGVSDLISNFGGLLGLFTGFSLISLAEIIYFCSLRIFYNRRLFGDWSGPQE